MGKLFYLSNTKTALISWEFNLRTRLVKKQLNLRINNAYKIFSISGDSYADQYRYPNFAIV